MAATPLITFKAGLCEVNGLKVTCLPTPGYVYLYAEDDLLHFCWRPRTAPSTEPELDLLMIQTDGSFYALGGEHTTAEETHSPTNGRIVVLKFASSSQKHLFWMQSKSQAKNGKESGFSQRDSNIIQIVHDLLQGEDVDVDAQMAEQDHGDNAGPDGDADAMEIDQGSSLRRQRSGGAGQDATGGDTREEGETSREGGADGGRAGSENANKLVQDFLQSFATESNQNQGADKPFTTLPDLLPSSVMISYIHSASSIQIDELCSLLPPDLFLIAQESAPSESDAESGSAAAQAAIEALSTDQKKAVITRVLHSPQLQQSMASLTVALRDGGLPMIGEALRLKVENGGHIKGGSMPLGGGEAVEAFVTGVKRTVEEEKK